MNIVSIIYNARLNLQFVDKYFISKLRQNKNLLQNQIHFNNEAKKTFISVQIHTMKYNNT